MLESICSKLCGTDLSKSHLCEAFKYSPPKIMCLKTLTNTYATRTPCCTSLVTPNSSFLASNEDLDIAQAKCTSGLQRQNRGKQKLEAFLISQIHASLSPLSSHLLPRNLSQYVML